MRAISFGNQIALLSRIIFNWGIAALLLLTLSFLPLVSNAAEIGDDYEALTPDQAEMADQMLAFMDKMEGKFLTL